MRKIGIAIGIVLLVCSLQAQKKSDFSVMEDSIISLHAGMLSEPISEIRYQKNEQLLYLLEEMLQMKNSFNYKFDSLKTISILTSADKKVRIFTWYVMDDRNNCEYFGFLQSYNEQQKRYMVYPLTDKSSRIANPNTQTLTHHSWFGAMYTHLLETQTSTHTYYTLLGWNGGNIFSQYKVIDVLSINTKGAPTFGAPIFRNYSKTKVYRIVFEYARNSKLHLDYSKEYYARRSGKKDKHTHKYTYDTIATNMIIFNRLIPIDESLANVPQYYVPEASLNDGFIEQDGRWVFKPGVEGRNKEQKKETEGTVRRSAPRTFYKPK